MVLAETTGEDSIYYLHGLDLVEQSDGANVEYFAYDGLGSVRQVLDDGASVLLAQTYDPYGSVYESVGAGETRFGFTGEQVDASGLVYLRARYYSPSQGRFFQRDTWEGDANRPQSLNPYMYVEGRPVNWIDPDGHGYVPDSDDWVDAEGWAETYWPVSIQFVIEYRRHIIAAAQRHSFIPQSVSTATPEQQDILYTLAAIVYQEAHGHYVDDPSKTPIPGLIYWIGVTAPYLGNDCPTMGVAQVNRDTTAVEVEEAGLVYDPGTRTNPNTLPISSPDVGEAQFGISVLDSEYIIVDVTSQARGARLLDPVWGIEYAAANMDWATYQPEFDLPWDHHVQPAEGEIVHLSASERMTAWYQAGHFDVTVGDPGIPESGDVTHYLNMTYSTKTALRNLDMLNIETLLP